MGKALSLLLTIVLAAPLCSEVIDRIVAVVEGEIITLSDIRAERTLREVLGEQIARNDSEILDELIDQHLIHPQLETFTRVDPSEEELNARMAEIKDRKGLPEPTIREALKEHIHTQRFFDQKFREFVMPTPDEVRKYYEDVFVPAAKSKGLSPIPPLAEVEGGIRSNIVEEKSAKQIEAWLKQTRKTAKIEIVPSSAPENGTP